MSAHKSRWHRVGTFVLDYSGFRWLQDDFLTAALAYLAIAAALTLLGLVVYAGFKIGAF